MTQASKDYYENLLLEKTPENSIKDKIKEAQWQIDAAHDQIASGKFMLEKWEYILNRYKNATKVLEGKTMTEHTQQSSKKQEQKKGFSESKSTDLIVHGNLFIGFTPENDPIKTSGDGPIKKFEGFVMKECVIIPKSRILNFGELSDTANALNGSPEADDVCFEVKVVKPEPKPIIEWEDEA